MIDILSTQVKGVLENEVFRQVSSLNLNIQSATLRAIVSRAAEELSVLVSQSVNTSTNKQLEDIPKNLIGNKNPVDLVNSNIGSSGLTSNLSNIIDTQLNAALTDRLVTIIESELKLALPQDKRSVINFTALAATLTQLVTPAVSSSINTALSGIAGAIFGRNNSTPLTIQGVTGLFGRLNSGIALEQLTSQFSSSIANKYLTQAQNFSITNEDNQQKLTATKRGFIDPEANYPTQEYAGISETNKLAQGDARGTIVQDKNQKRMTGAKLPGGEAWDQPESPFKGEYPYNKVTQTESGHIIEMDDTPGAERIHMYHRTGTFVEIDANGSVVVRSVGSKYEIIDCNGKIAISGKADISVNGACNIFVGNDANIEVEGDCNLTCHNDITAQAGGKLNLSATEELNISSANVNIEAYNAMNVKSNVSLLMSASDVVSMRSNTQFFLQSQELYQNTTTEFNMTKNLHEMVEEGSYRSADNFHVKTGSDIFINAGGDINNLAGGDFNADGSAVHLNSGNSTGADDPEESKSANIAGISNIGILSGRKDIEEIVVDDPVSLTLADPYALRLEEDQDAGDRASHRDLILTSGFATAEEFDEKPVVLDTDSGASQQSIMVQPDEELKKFTELPGNFNLSPNFTVEDLSSKAALTKSFITPVDGELTYGEIVYNLQAIALNILEPAYNVYPTLIVASGYRTKEISSKNSMHPTGKCVDIQFQGATKEDYYEFAKQLVKVLNYDELILHYCNYTNNPWIHISYSGSNNRKKVSTFWNNIKHSDGLSKLA